MGAQGHGKGILTQFYRQLIQRQFSSLKVVTGDGGLRWVMECMNEFTPGCECCVDPFHIVEWAMEALDKVLSPDCPKTRDFPAILTILSTKNARFFGHYLFVSG